MRKKIGLALCIVALASSLSAQSTSVLGSLNSDFDAFLTGITRDIAPNLQMVSLAGDLVGDATLDKFTLLLPMVGVNLSSGLGSILKAGSHKWDFVLPMDSIIGSVTDKDATLKKWINMLETELYPSAAIKLGFGFGLGGGWDVMLNGSWLPQALVDWVVSLANSPTITALKPQLTTFNIGVKVRKTLLEDKDAVPALSLGLGYTIGYSELGLTVPSMKTLSGSDLDVGFGKLNLTGNLAFQSIVHSVGFDLHISKHLSVFTPFIKLSGLYEYAKSSANANLMATITPTSVGGSTLTQAIASNPATIVSDFTALATLGFELDFVVIVLDVNMAIDLQRAKFALADNPLGFKGNGVNVNAGLRWVF